MERRRVPRVSEVDGVTSITVAGGVVFAGVSYNGAPGWIQTVDAATGKPLGENDGVFGPGANDPVVVNGHVYLINDNRLYIYALAS